MSFKQLKDMEKNFSLSIYKIKELEFSISTKPTSENNLSLSFGVVSEFDLDNETFEIQIIYDLKSAEKNSTLLHIKVSNVFKVQNLKDYFVKKQKKLNIPDIGLTTMLSLSISHARALLAKNTSGTDFENYYIPIVNPAEIAKQVFNIK
jgi:hypothetical protein